MMEGYMLGIFIPDKLNKPIELTFTNVNDPDDIRYVTLEKVLIHPDLTEEYKELLVEGLNNIIQKIKTNEPLVRSVN